MPLLPDPAVAALYALVAILVTLSGLVVFVEAIRLSRAIVLLVGDAALAIVLMLVGEFGLALVVLGVGGAVFANQIFEWLTTR